MVNLPYLLGGLLLIIGALDASPVVSMLPQSQSMPLGSTDVFAITVDGIVTGGPPSVGAFDLVVTYDPALLSLQNWFWDNSLDLFGLGSLQTVSMSIGSVSASEVSLDTTDDLHTFQQDLILLGVLQFEAIAVGVSPISIQIVALSDAFGGPLEFTIINGQIDVTDTDEVPEPNTALLSGFALLAMIGGLGSSLRHKIVGALQSRMQSR